MTDRFTASTITDDQLDALYADRDRLAAVADADSKQLAEVDARCDRYAATIARVRKYITGRQSAWPDNWSVVVPARHVLAALDGPQAPADDTLEATIARVRATLQTCKTSGRTGRGYYAEVLAALDGPQHTCPDGEPCPPHDEPAPGADDNPRQPAYDAVYAYLRTMPQGGVERNAIIWRAVQAALDAMQQPDSPQTAAEEQCCGGGPRGDCPCMYPADSALAQQRAAGYAAQADAIERTEHADLNRHHMRPGNDDTAEENAQP